MFSLSGRTTFNHQSSRLVGALLTMLLLASTLMTARAQGGGGTDSTGTGGKHIIHGRIYFPSGRSADLRAKVKLQSTNSGELSVLADIDGAFRFTNLGAGSYTVIIEAGEEYETARETVYIEGNSSLGRGMRMTTIARTVMLPIYLQTKRLGKASNQPGVVNAALANIPKAAADLYTEALISARAGDSKKAIEQLKGALSLHPEFALALNELGVQYLKLGQADRAAEVLQRAVAITPDANIPRLNYGIALLEKKDFAGAEVQLRQVLAKNDAVATAHYYLGLVLISLRNYAEAEKELRRAMGLAPNELSMAHYYLGGIFWRNKEYKRAADELEKYLQKVPKAPDAERIRATIKELRGKQTTPTS
jgi:tetratricopeptide (TPR) repeat protein